MDQKINWQKNILAQKPNTSKGVGLPNLTRTFYLLSSGGWVKETTGCLFGSFYILHAVIVLVIITQRAKATTHKVVRKDNTSHRPKIPLRAFSTGKRIHVYCVIVTSQCNDLAKHFWHVPPISVELSVGETQDFRDHVQN